MHISDELEVNDEKAKVASLLDKEFESEEARRKEFKECTGLSDKTYYRIKNNL